MALSFGEKSFIVLGFHVDQGRSPLGEIFLNSGFATKSAFRNVQVLGATKICAQYLNIRQRDQLHHYGTESQTVLLMSAKPGQPLRDVIPYDLIKRRNSTDNLEWDKKCLDCTSGVTCLAFGQRSSDARWHTDQVSYNRLHNFPRDKIILAAGLTNGEIRIWDSETGKIVTVLQDHKLPITSLQFSPDGSLVLASASRDGNVKLWDMLDDGNMFRTLAGHSKPINAIAWSPDARQLASVGAARTALIWDSRSGEVHRKLDGHQNDVTGCSFSPDGALLFTSSCDTKAICWDVFTGEQKAVYSHMFPPPRPIFAGGVNGHEVRGLDVSFDGKHLATFCKDGFVRIWNICDPSLPVQKAEILDSRCMAYSYDGFIFAVGSQNGTIHFFASPMCIGSLQHHCRMSALRSLRNGASSLNLPKKAISYLNYSDIRL